MKSSVTDRNTEIRMLRTQGMTLEAIADRFGLTRERVRQIIGPVNAIRFCVVCGQGFVTHGSARACPKCKTCPTCGGPKQARNQYCSHRCRPPSKKASSRGATYRRQEHGIYKRVYIASGYQLPGYYVADLHPTFRLRRFDTLEEAREYRASNKWRKHPDDPSTWIDRGETRRFVT